MRSLPRPPRPTCSSTSGMRCAALGRTEPASRAWNSSSAAPGQPIVEAKVLGQVADAPARFGVARRLAEQARLAAGRPHQAEQDLDRRRLARAVRAQEAEHLTRLDREVQPVKRDFAAVLLAEGDRLDRGCQRTPRLSAMRFRSVALSEPATPYRWPLACQMAALPTPELSLSSRPWLPLKVVDCQLTLSTGIGIGSVSFQFWICRSWLTVAAAGRADRAGSRASRAG